MTAFVQTCGAQVKSGRISDKSEVVAMSQAQIAELAANMGMEVVPEFVWVDRNANWFQVQVKMDVPEACSMYFLRVAHADAIVAWTAAFENNRAWRTGGLPTLSEHQKFNRLYAYASQPFEDGFVQAFMNGFEFKNGGRFVSLEMIKTKNAPAPCELWPEECK